MVIFVGELEKLNLEIVDISNFLKIVDPKVLERGKTYLDDGTIVELEELGQHDFNAIVLGSEAYNVNIVLNSQGELFTHSCNCPYDASAICKHKVAVLLLIQQMKREQQVFEKGNLTAIKKELQAYPQEELVQLLMTFAKSDLKLRKRLLFELGLRG